MQTLGLKLSEGAGALGAWRIGMQIAKWKMENVYWHK